MAAIAPLCTAIAIALACSSIALRSSPSLALTVICIAMGGCAFALCRGLSAVRISSPRFAIKGTSSGRKPAIPPEWYLGREAVENALVALLACPAIPPLCATEKSCLSGLDIDAFKVCFSSPLMKLFPKAAMDCLAFLLPLASEKSDFSKEPTDALAIFCASLCRTIALRWRVLSRVAWLSGVLSSAIASALSRSCLVVSAISRSVIRKLGIFHSPVIGMLSPSIFLWQFAP